MHWDLEFRVLTPSADLDAGVVATAAETASVVFAAAGAAEAEAVAVAVVVAVAAAAEHSSASVLSRLWRSALGREQTGREFLATLVSRSGHFQNAAAEVSR